MTKILLLLCVLATFTATQAQSVVNRTLRLTNTGTVTFDTVTTASTVYLYTRAIDYSFETMEIQLLLDEIGTPTTAGSVVLQKSQSAVAGTWVAAAAGGTADSTFTMTNVAQQTYTWKIVDPSSYYYRLAITVSGTPSLKYQARYTGFLRK